jgi:hypothetical protein
MQQPWTPVQKRRLAFIRRYKREASASLGAMPLLRRCTPFCLPLVLITMVAILAGRILGTDAATDPFTAYTAFMPGTARPSGTDFQCEVPYEYPQAAGYFYCVQYIRNHNVLRWISVSGSNGIVGRIGFGVRLRYGDLVALFGRAQRISGTRWSKTLYWQGMQAYVSLPRGSRLNLQSRVSYVAFFIEEPRNE